MGPQLLLFLPEPTAQAFSPTYPHQGETLAAHSHPATLGAIHLACGQPSAPPRVPHAHPNCAVIPALLAHMSQVRTLTQPMCPGHLWLLLPRTEGSTPIRSRTYATNEGLVSTDTQEIHGNKLLEINCLVLVSLLFIPRVNPPETNAIVLLYLPNT